MPIVKGDGHAGKAAIYDWERQVVFPLSLSLAHTLSLSLSVSLSLPLSLSRALSLILTRARMRTVASRWGGDQGVPRQGMAEKNAPQARSRNGQEPKTGMRMCNDYTTIAGGSNVCVHACQ